MRFLYYCVTYLWLCIYESLLLLPICFFYDSKLITAFLGGTCLVINTIILGVFYYEDI